MRRLWNCRGAAHGARTVGSGSGCGAPGVTTDRFNRFPKEHSYRGNRSKYSWEVGRNWRIGDISGVRSGCKYRSN